MYLIKILSKIILASVKILVILLILLSMLIFPNYLFSQTVKWNNVSGATFYQLKCGTKSGVYLFTTKVIPPLTQVELKSFITSPGIFFCVVGSVNENGIGSFTTEKVFTIPSKPILPAPKNFRKASP